MAQIDFIGPSYTLRSVTVDCQKTVNLYVDGDETGKGKSNVFLTGTPGLKLYQTIASVIDENSEIRGMITGSKNDLFVVCGNNFVKIYKDDDGELLQRVLGTLITNTGQVGIADNGFQVGIVDGDNYYIYNYETDIYQQYTDTTNPFPGSNTITYFSTYFVFIERETQKFFISGIYDPYTLDPLSFASCEANPDNLVTSLTLNQNLFLFGTESIEVWFNSGASDFPLAPMNGGYIQFGCIAPFSVINCQNRPIFLGKDKNGSGTIYQINGYECNRISNFAVEFSIQNIEDLSTASAYAYQQEGHYFYAINFPSANTTWVYDLTTQMWHERQYFNPILAQPERQRQQLHVFWNNKHLVSDYKKNKIYDMSLDYYDDDGASIQRIRRSPHQSSPDLQRISFREFQLDLDVGSPFDISYETTPKIYLRFSNDGGKTWSNYIQYNLDGAGNYKTRVIWRRLGMARDRVWEVLLSDPIKTVWLNARAVVELGKT